MVVMSSWTAIQVDPTSFKADEMILLTDGSVLIHNANTSPTTFASASAKQWLRMKPDNYGNYANPSWSSTISMGSARQFFASGMLRDGRVFVIGGEYSNDLPPITPSQTPGLDSPLGEIFDPVTSQWTPLTKPATFNYIQGDVPACVLADGRVLVGGINNPPQTAIWDPAYNTWTAAGTGGAKVATPSEETWTLLPDGSVLAVDVFSQPPGAAERYIPATDKWVTAQSPPDKLVLQQVTSPQFGVVAVNEIGPAILLPNGTAFAIGATGQTALYNPAAVANPWSAGPSFPLDTSGSNLSQTLTAIDAPACLLPNGKVVCIAGLTTVLPPTPATNKATSWSNNLQFFEFDPSTNVTPIPLLDKQPNQGQWPGTGTYTWQCWFLLLPTGQLLCSAGQNTLYLYQPDGLPQPGWKPTITSAPATMVSGETYTITGTQLNGLSQAVSYGDDGQMATNYPLVQLTNLFVSPQTVAYLRTFNFSSLGVAMPGPVSAQVEVPCDLEPGQYNLAVIANGIASDPVPVQIVAMSFARPLGFNNWTKNTEVGADDPGDSVQLGGYNHLTHFTNGVADTDDANTTMVANIAEQSAAICGQNQSPGSGVVGIAGQSNGCRGSIGVVGSATGWGVAGLATSEPVDVLNNGNAANFSPYPSNVGVFGAGDNFGVYGQNRASESQQATPLRPPGNVGVYGVGDAAGVQGDSDHVDSAGDDIGTGVVGTSIQGVGVLGQAVGSPNPAATIPPYIGIHGLSQANPTLPYPTSPDYVGTGVLGVGDVRGGVFKATPDDTAETFANVRLNPLPLGAQKNLLEGYAPGLPPQLPRQGAPGDILAVQTKDADGHPSVELWICIRPPLGTGPRKLGASWARIHFDNVVTMPSAG